MYWIGRKGLLSGTRAECVPMLSFTVGIHTVYRKDQVSPETAMLPRKLYVGHWFAAYVNPRFSIFSSFLFWRYDLSQKMTRAMLGTIMASDLRKCATPHPVGSQTLLSAVVGTRRVKRGCCVADWGLLHTAPDRIQESQSRCQGSRVTRWAECSTIASCSLSSACVIIIEI